MVNNFFGKKGRGGGHGHGGSGCGGNGSKESTVYGVGLSPEEEWCPMLSAVEEKVEEKEEEEEEEKEEEEESIDNSGAELSSTLMKMEMQKNSKIDKRKCFC
jgi:hypothetical protein